MRPTERPDPACAERRATPTTRPTKCPDPAYYQHAEQRVAPTSQATEADDDDERPRLNDSGAGGLGNFFIT